MFFTQNAAELFFGWAKYTVALSEMSIEAAEIIMRRTTRMANGSMTASEATEMLTEKATAFAESQGNAVAAATSGGAPLAILDAALAPYGEQTRANVAMLRG
jgi:hypothetical protein